jgi:hypothetical protein
MFSAAGPEPRPAKRLGLAVVADGRDGPGRLLPPATVDPDLAAVSSFYDWAIVAEEYEHSVSSVQMRDDPGLTPGGLGGQHWDTSVGGDSKYHPSGLGTKASLPTMKWRSTRVTRA